jgi:hypothetical protein
LLKPSIFPLKTLKPFKILHISIKNPKTDLNPPYFHDKSRENVKTPPYFLIITVNIYNIVKIPPYLL